jgi:hypothetical protein
MLGKQWLNRYESADMRGTAIERSQNRQRKRDGIDAWYFDTVMESLPLMLQVSLLLLGCALSLYLWGIDSIIASVVISITSIGVTVYLFITIAGATTDSCPYQTPGSKLLRRRRSRGQTLRFLRGLISEVPPAIGADARGLLRAAIRVLAALPARAYNIYNAHNWLNHPSPPPERRETWQTAVLDLRCISWTLQTSLNRAVHLSALEYLMSALKLAGLDPTLVVDCFNIFIRGILVDEGRVAIMQGLEQFATVAAGCFCSTFYHLTAMDPTSSILEDIRRRYRRVLPDGIDFTDLPSRHSMIMIDALIRKDWGLRHVWRSNDRPSDHEHIPFARDVAELAQAEYQREQEVPEWILGFVYNSLSLVPLPPASIVADCLKTIAVHLGCSVQPVVTLDERYTP